MTDEIQKSEERKTKMSFFDYATEVIGWVQIFLSPFLAGLVIAAIIYFSNPSTLRLIIAMAMALIGLIVGIVFATRVWKRKGTIHFVSRVMATPELDNLEEDKK